VPNPVEILGHARHRIAKVAAVRTFVYWLAPAAVTAVLAMWLEPVGRALWGRLGYVPALERVALMRTALAAGAGLELAVGAVLAWRAWRRASDFVEAAGAVDGLVHGHEQILTFATLADPAAPTQQRAQRTPLFPILRRTALALLDKFDPTRAFPLNLGRPLARSSLIALGVGAILVLGTLGSVRAPTPAMAQAEKLREIAREIEKSATSPADLAIAEKTRAAAAALENPKLPPEEKLKRIEEVMREIEQQKKSAAGAQSEKGAGSGASEAKSGEGQGKGEAKGKGEGGEGSSGKGKGDQGPGTGTGANNKGAKQGNKQSIELQNELKKAEAQIETEGAQNKSPTPRPGGGEGNAPKAGTSPNEKGPGTQPDLNQPGNIPKQGAQGEKNIPQRGGSQQQSADMGSHQGDTHLGEFPSPVKYQRYLKPGEKGANLDIKDARYVMFRLPGAIPAGAGGTTVIDKGRPKASTPYVNAPLAPTRDNAPPDERQPVPPRYRDLIH
jgi:hypothetical protein